MKLFGFEPPKKGFASGSQKDTARLGYDRDKNSLKRTN